VTMMSIDHTTIFMDHIRMHAPSYYPGFESEQLKIQLLEKQERPTAMLYRFKVSNGAQVRSVFVKVPLRNLTKNQTKGSVFEKPLLFPKTEPIDMPRLQYSALKIIDKYITSLDKSQLGAIRVLDYLPQYKAVFTEESSDPSLRLLFLRENRLRSLFTHGELTTAFQNVGTWLYMYHVMPKKEDVKVRHQHREDYVEAITKLTDFLAKVLGDELFFKKTASIIIKKGREVFPETLPLGLGHGDYAMRNILIGQNARVTVLDTFAKWRTPIYEDIGYFLNGLKMSPQQIFSQGLAFSSDQLSAYEMAFLKGYFEQKSIPYPAIRLFEVLALLDRWSSVIARNHQRRFKFRFFGSVTTAMTSRYLKRSLKDLLKEITES
jgi:hypothetical protein